MNIDREAVLHRKQREGHRRGHGRNRVTFRMCLGITSELQLIIRLLKTHLNNLTHSMKKPGEPTYSIPIEAVSGLIRSFLQAANA